MGKTFCQMLYNEKTYDIESINSYNSMPFSRVLNQIKQMIPAIDCTINGSMDFNKQVNFSTHTFELYDSSTTRFQRISNLHEVIKIDAIIRVIDLNINTPAYVRAPPLPRATPLPPRAAPLPPRPLFPVLTTATNNHTNRPPIGVYRPPLDPRLSGEEVFTRTPPVVDSQPLISGINAYIKERFHMFLDAIKTYSQNNCDLITDFEWISVIHKEMTSKGFLNYESSVWQKCYQIYVNKYIETLEGCGDYFSARNVFAYFNEFNELYFNEINVNYNRLMTARNRFIERFDLVLNNSHSEHPDISCHKILCKTFQFQLKLENMAKNDSGLTTELQTNVREVKVFNLIVQTIGALRGQLKEPTLFQTIAQILAKYGIHWTSNQCQSVVKHWILFYEKNLDFYRVILKTDNKVVQYIYEFLNIITTLIQNLKTIFYYNNSLSASLDLIDRRPPKAKLQKRLLIEDSYLKDFVNNTDKDLQKSRNEDNVSHNSSANTTGRSSNTRPHSSQSRREEPRNSRDRDRYDRTRREYERSPKHRESKERDRHRDRDRSVSKTSGHSKSNSIKERDLNNGLERGKLAKNNLKSPEKRGENSKGSEEKSKKKFNDKSDRNDSKLELSSEEVMKFQVLLNECKDYSDNNIDLIVDYEWINIIHNKMLDKGYKDCAPQEWQSVYRKLVKNYLNVLRKCQTSETALEMFPFFDLFNAIHFNEINTYYNDIMSAREEFVRRLVTTNSRVKQLLVRTLFNQRRDSCEQSLNPKLNKFQTDLQTDIEAIKTVNLLIQILKQMPNRSNVYQRLAGILTAAKVKTYFNSYTWYATNCRQALRYWTIFYANNIQNYETTLRSHNKIVKYIFGFLNIIHSIVSSDIPDLYDERSMFGALKTIRNTNEYETISFVLISNEITKQIEDNINDSNSFGDKDYRSPDKDYRRRDRDYRNEDKGYRSDGSDKSVKDWNKRPISESKHLFAAKKFKY